MVLQKSLEIFLAVFTKEEAVDLGTQLLEGEVGRGENSPPNMIRGVCNGRQKTSLCEAEFQGTELAREELDNLGD